MEEAPPQQYVEYPRMPFRPRLRFEAIGEAWKLFAAKPGIWIVAGLLTSLLMIALAAPLYALSIISMMGNRRPEVMDILMLYGAMFIAVTLAYIGQAVGYAGMTNMALKQIQGHDVGVGDFFKTGGSVFSHIAAGFLVTMGILIGSMFCYLPGFMLGGLFLLVHPILVHEKLGAIDALRRSWDIMKPDLWPATGMYAILGIIISVSPLACGVGLFVALPLFVLTTSLIYRDFLIAAQPGYDPNGTPAPHNINAS